MRPARPPRLPAAIARAAVALAVFVPVVGGYLAGSNYVLAHRALPDSGGASGACAMWLIGSSSMHRWRTAAAALPGWVVHNRGIEGASLDQIRTRLESTPAERPPGAVLLYAGENDIARGTGGAEAARRMIALVDAVIARAPEAPVFVVAMKPSPTRWPDRPQQHRFDQAMRRLAARSEHVTFLHASDVLLVDGRPGPFYQADGIHLDAAGYRRWGGAIGAALARATPSSIVNHCKALRAQDGAQTTV